MQKTAITLLALALMFQLYGQQKKVVNPTLVIRSQVKNTIRVSEMKRVTPQEWQQMKAEGERKGLRERKKRTTPSVMPQGNDPVIQNFMWGERGANAPLLTFDGANCAFYPSDACGSVDSNYYVQTVNATFSVYDKTGTLLAGPIATNTLFNGLPGSTHNDGDAIVLFDDQANRWLITEMSKSGSNDYLMMAVSQSSNPLGTWYAYSFDVDDWPDYPKYGIWRDGYYIGVDKIGNNTEDQEDVFAVERSKMLQGLTARIVGFINPDRPNTTYTIAAPVDNDGAFAPANSPGLFVAVNNDGWTLPKDQLWIYEMDVDWNNIYNSTFGRVQALDVANFDPAPDPEMPGGGTLDGLAGYVMNKPVYRNFNNHQELVLSHNVTGSSGFNAGIRWYELRKTDGQWAIRQQGTYSPDNDSRWVGSITMNANHRIAVGYSVSGAATYPSIRYAAQSPSAYAAASGLLDVAEETVFTGNNIQSSNRWGDYSNISVDPSNDSIFWYTNQYVGSSGIKTKISKFKFGPFSLTSDFFADNTEAEINVIVKFYDLSYGNPATWKWSFSPSAAVSYAGGTSDTSQNPWVQFSQPGTYSVTLVTGNGSVSDTLVRNAYITINNICTVGTFPWSEDFENGGSMPVCWSQEYANHYNEDWKFQNGDSLYISAHSGSYNAYFLKNDAETRLVLPPMDLSNLTAAQMDFWYVSDGAYGAYYTFKVLYKSSENATWSVIKTYSSPTSGWTHDTIVLPQNTSDSWIAFETADNNSSYGLNIDDITIRESTISCAQPLDPETEPAASSAVTKWISQPYSPKWEVEYGAAGFSHGSGTSVKNITDTTYTITGLTPETAYDWYVRKYCPPDTSNWTGPIRFTTTKTPYTIPFSEDFESGLGKFFNPAGNSNDFLSSTSLQHNGSKCAYNGYQFNGTSYLEMSSFIDLSAASFPVLSFWHIAKVNNDGDYCKVQISADNGSTWKTLPVIAYDGEAANYSAYQRFDEDSYSVWAGSPATNTWWKKETFVLDDYKNKQVKIRFLLSANSNGFDEGWYIDDVLIEDETCPGIYSDSLWTNTITDNSAALKWREKGNATAWDIEYGTAGFTQGSGTTVTATNSNPYSLSGLSASSNYDWYVRSHCGSGNYSNWRGPVTFTTPCAPVALPYFEDFENVTAPALPSCFTAEDANNDNVQWNTVSYNGFSGTQSVTVGTPTGKSSDDWFFTPGITLQAGVSYQISFVYATLSGHEVLQLKYGDYPDAASMNSTALFEDNDITGWDWTLGYALFTPATTKVYYFGFHAASPIGTGGIALDDIYVNFNSATAQWTGGASEDWYNAANWNNDTLPGAGTTVTVSAPSVNYPTLTKLSVAKNIYLGSASENASLMGENFLKVTGSTYVQQKLYAGKWHLLTAPVKNATVNQLFLNHNPDVWLIGYNEPTDDWTYITDLTTPMPLAAGYAVWVEAGRDTTVTFSGPLNSDDIYLDSSPWSSPPVLSFTDAAHGYNLVGNPFPSALDWDSSGWDTTNISGSIWVWDPLAGNYAYRNSQGQGSLTDGIIPRGQGFFIKGKSTDMYFTIPNSARVHSHQNFYKNREKTGNPYAVISCSKEGMSDEVWISFSEGATERFDDGYDVEKLFSMDEAPQLWCNDNGMDLSIVSKPPMTSGSRMFPLLFKAGPAGTQTLELKQTELTGNYDIFLEDTKLNRFVNFKKNRVYTFQAVSYQNPARFNLHFTLNANAVSTGQSPGKALIYAARKRIYIKRNSTVSNGEAVAEVYDLLGRKLSSVKSDKEMITLNVPVNNAYVVVKLTEKSGTTVKKLFYR